MQIDASQLKGGVFGFLLVVMMVLRPEGLLPERRRRLEFEEYADPRFSEKTAGAQAYAWPGPGR